MTPNSEPRTTPPARELGITYGTVCLSCGAWHYTYSLVGAIERPCAMCEAKQRARDAALGRWTRRREWLPVVLALVAVTVALTIYVWRGR